MSALFSDPIGHSEWIKANPDRWYRITLRDKQVGWGLVYVEIMHVTEGRRIWGMQNIYMRTELPDADEGAKIALKEEEVICNALMRQARGGTKHISELLAMLRGKSPAGMQ